MSSTLTWYNSGLGTKTGTTSAALITNLVTLINSKLANADFSWQVASSVATGSTYHIVLKRKDGSAGRILLVIFTSAPANIHSTLFDGITPSINQLYGAFFPAGNTDTPVGLTAASGTILGDDTGAVKVWGAMDAGTIYAVNCKSFYFDSYDAVVFGFDHSGANQTYMSGAGYLIVDSVDTAYPATIGLANNATYTFGGVGTSAFPWQPGRTEAGDVYPVVRTNLGSPAKQYFSGWLPGNWAAQTVTSDLLTDGANSKAYFVPVQLIGHTKGEGFVFKLRQIAMGPTSSAAASIYSTTGPVVAARQFSHQVGGAAGVPWMVNFKL